MIYQCTKEIIKSLKIEIIDKPEIYNALFAWHVKVLKVNRRNLIYLMNDATKLSVILYGFTAKEFKGFDDYVKKGIADILGDCGVSSLIVQRYLDQIGEAIFTSTGTRKQLGVLNRAALEIEYFWHDLAEEGMLQRKLCEYQNRGLLKNDNGDYVTPKIITKNLFEQTFGSHMVRFDLEKITNLMFMDSDKAYVSFLNMRDGSTCIEKRHTEKCQALDDHEDYIYIQHGQFDFFHHFNRFAKTIDHDQFHQDLERDGHGNGAIGRIKDLLENYTDIQMKWYAYKDGEEQGSAKKWLASVGLM